jgi:Xaa-Pro aminopeptidase
MSTILNRIASFRKVMQENGIHACIIPGTDPHASEYIADHWKERDWISGFDGSAGTIVITLENAGLWTDSRYFLQAENQLQGSSIKLMKMGLAETPGIVAWLTSVLKPGETVGVNAQMFSVNAWSSMQSDLNKYDIALTNVDISGKIWSDRPAIPTFQAFSQPEKYAGKSTGDKLSQVQEMMQKNLADVLILTALDDIAWLFNMRGYDVSYNPVVIAYAMIFRDHTILYINPDKITPEVSENLTKNKVEVKRYEDINSDISQIANNLTVWIDGGKLNQSLYAQIPASCKIVNQMSPVFKLKSIKNEVEIAGFKNAMIKDGVALTKFFIWLEKSIPEGIVTETLISDKLKEYRSQQDLFYGESFGTIAGFADHGAVIHYKADESSSYDVKPGHILLIDSGGQYFDGTTDITRTISTGNPTAEQKLDYTLVLKGHIALATAVFPTGTRGSQLDILARKAMWDRAMNYGHGTGHGIGHFLNVHEGPQNIRMDENPVVLEPGMMLSNEPGMYRDGKHGFRTENLILVKEHIKTVFGSFLQFETLTLFPIDTTLIDFDIFTQEEKNWLNQYHQEVYNKISPFLSGDEKSWLSMHTQAI